MKNTSFAVAAIAAAGFSLAQPSLGQSNEKLGIVNFETSCKPEAQKLFNQGMLFISTRSGIALRKRFSKMR